MLYLLLIGCAVGLAIKPHFNAFAPLYTPEAFAAEQPLPFPQWLADFTGCTEWPGMNPPYIPLDFVNLDNLPENLENWIHAEGVCGDVASSAACSFDCYNCVMSEDVHTCPSLTQTFDDGPSPFTPTLTSALTTPLTFFTIGVNVVRFPQIYRDTANKGHIMGCHTWLHPFLPGQTNTQIVAQIEWLIWAMNATYGHLPKWFRPPYGGIDNRVRAIIHQFGMQAVLWDFDTFDWQLAANNDDFGTDAMYGSVSNFIESNDHRGLILEHDSMAHTVNIGIHLHGLIGLEQMTVPQCAGGIDYVKNFNFDK